MEIAALLGFSLVLIMCVLFDVYILYALVAGYVIFFCYGLHRGHGWRQILKMSWEGIITVKNILLTFVLIGMLTALWRACGTIPVIVAYASDFINPFVFYLAAFLLNGLVSVLTGTSFGTAATVGTIVMTMSAVMGMSPALAGGAVLAGAYFGDRCSPVSTSALLVAQLTGTDIYQNIRAMIKTCIIPLALTCLIYWLAGNYWSVGAGLVVHADGTVGLSMHELFNPVFGTGIIPLIPAIVILVLAMLQTPVKQAMLASIIAALPICVFYQGLAMPDILHYTVWGYGAADPQIAALLNGGGITSMKNVIAIVCLSSSYAGIFQGTGLLNGLKAIVAGLEAKYSHFAVTFLASIVTSMIACNQTLAIMLTHQLCDGGDKTALTDTYRAICLEDSVVLLAPLVPWSIAGTAPLYSAGAPIDSLFFAVYLYILPLYHLLREKHLRNV